ncbi:MAG TPA: tetratricopeptide repeat protein [Acidobacteriota bacterium]|nr:tetratricopeptide repeat protein [Acidobacteriota bacterium]
MFLARVLLISLLAPPLSGGQEPSPASQRDLGEIDFPVSGSPMARQHFIRGVLWLHSFEYPEARESFQKAQEADPDMAMAYWGEAMTWNHPLWNRENREQARQALQKLGADGQERLAKAPTEREKDYLRAVEILFSEKEKTVRDQEYAEFMGRMRERYPEDLEAASFYALALLGTCHQGRHIPTYMRAAAVAEEVFLKNPRHPGALHYLIHSYDDPVHAPLGLRQARLYADIAPSAAHALHMPSHIFLALGMWDDTEASNIDSYRAGEQRRQKRDLPLSERNYHALYWLHYSLLQQGRYGEAMSKLRLVEEDASKDEAAHIRRHQALMRAAQMVESRRFDEAPPAAGTQGLNPSSLAAQFFADGWAALRDGRLQRAQQIVQEMNERRRQAEAGQRGDTAGYTRVGPPPTQEAQVMALQLQGLLALAREEASQGLDLLHEAAAREAELPAGFGPPVPVKPSHELLGEVLLERGRAAQAVEAFQQSLQRHPNRALSLLGLMRAASAAGDGEAAEKARRRLAEVWKDADDEVRPSQLTSGVG